MKPPTPFEQILALLAQCSEQERGRLRYILTRPGQHKPGDPAKVGTNVVGGNGGMK